MNFSIEGDSAFNVTSTIKNWLNQNYTSDGELGSVQEIRNKSRDRYRNDAIASAIIKTMGQSVIGQGLTFQSDLNNYYLNLSNDQAEEIQRTIENRFSMWANSQLADFRRKLNFYEMQKLAYQTVLLSGDCFVTLPYRIIDNKIYLYINLFESEMVSTPKARMDEKDGRLFQGIEENTFGQPVAYHFENRGANGQITHRRVRAIRSNGSKNVLHCFFTERPGQRKGIPFLAPVLPKLYNLEKFTNTELVGAIVNSLFSVFIRSEKKDISTGIDGRGMGGEQDEDDNYDDLTMGSGSIVKLTPGDSVELAESKRPNKEFEGFINLLIKQIGAAVNIPSEVLMKTFNSSYSASRASLAQAYNNFKADRRFLVDNFCKPIFSQWLYGQVLNNDIELPGYLDDPYARMAYEGANWIGQSMIQIDPVKEARAAQVRIETGLSSIKQEAMELNGGDFARIHEQRTLEKQMRVDAGLEQGFQNTENTPRVDNEPNQDDNNVENERNNP